jgi:taurine dioxygenase
MQLATSRIKLEPLSPILGARVLGLDLAKPYGEETIAELRAAFAKYSVLCVPGQADLPYDDQVRFASVFGKADAAKLSNAEKGQGKARERGVMYVTNIRENGKPVGSLPDGEMEFHSDGSHRDIPYRATTLYAIQVPSKGGETKFANLYAAYDALPEATKKRIDGKMVKFIYQVDATNRSQTDENDPNLSNAVHPLVKVHPDTGRKSLYLSRLMTRYIIGMDRAESEELLLQLFDHAEKAEFIYAHPWKVNDVLIWDNRCTNHARNDFPASEIRQLRRITVSEPGDQSRADY